MNKLLLALRVAWALPNAVAGFAVTALVFVSGNSLVFQGNGVVEYRGWLARYRIRKRSVERGFLVTTTAVTIGETILIAASELVNLSTCHNDLWYRKLIAHEKEHVKQSRQWGPLFFPAYIACHVVRGYLNNPFERAAMKAEERVS
jgi:hypothetical protein